MNDLLYDFLNNRLAPVPTEGAVNGRIVVADDFGEEQSSDSAPESDTEKDEYIEKEIKSYFQGKEGDVDGLTDIDDGREESILGTDIMEMVHVPKVFDTFKFDKYCKNELPIDSYRSKILDMINTNTVVIIQGPTGCGKTTQVPQYILDQCKENRTPCNIVVTQPRRIAAINIAQRVCEERAWPIGSVCGYQVGLDKNVTDDVILTYMTTEVLLQKLISQKNLNRFTHVIIDEVHERNKSLDFLLLLVRKYVFTNSPEVKVILMSATMDEETFAYYFRSIPRNHSNQYIPAPILKVTKKSEFKTKIFYTEDIALQSVMYSMEEPGICAQQYEMCLKLLPIFDNLDAEIENAEKVIGSVLVFLPGFHEIEEMHKLLTGRPDWDVIPLHSSLTSEHMVKAFLKPKPGVRKIILSTNIAESSVTVPDVKYVIDFCLTKIMTTNESTKFATLSLQWASKNNCIQRAGRVGRVSHGRVYRLVPRDFYELQMQETTIPEIQRAPLENVILYMKLLELNDTPKHVLALALSPPNLADIETCIWRLKEVGALLQTCRGHKTAADGDLTFLGRVMGSLPIDISLSKLIVLGHMFSCLDETIIMAAGATTRNLFVHNFKDRFNCYKMKLLWADASQSDFMILLNLYNVWLTKKRSNAFRTINEEYAWCKTNYVNLKGLREWEILIREITTRLKRLRIEKAMGVAGIQLTPLEKPTVLKIIICGAFYPNYFVRSAEYGQVDSKNAVRILNGRDPYNTVYFTNMKVNQPGHIYVRQIKQLVKAENDDSVQIGFDKQCSKVFVEYQNVKRPESVMVDGRQYITTNPGNISPQVYEAVRRRQLGTACRLNLLSDAEAWKFASSAEEKYKKNKGEDEEFNCYSNVEYSPLPSLDIEYMSVNVTHIFDVGNFYCHNWNEETRLLLEKIFTALNGPGVFLEPAEKVVIRKQVYAARFLEDAKFYRCIVLALQHEKPDFAQVQFIDYGNTQKVPANLLCKLPGNCPDLRAEPIAMSCVLSGVQPHMVLNPKAIWSDTVNSIFKKEIEGRLLNAKVYSVVDRIVHLELFRQNAGPNAVSFNQWLVNEGYAQRCEESQRSKMDHETRQMVLKSENPNTVGSRYKDLSTATSYTDFEAPETSQACQTIDLRGPYSPLEMKVCGLVQATLGATVKVEGDSVNAVLLDDSPEDPHYRLMVAALVSQSGSNIKLSQTTIMPSIKGLATMVTLMFCPQMEPKLTPDGCRVASILCGLGKKAVSEKANFPMHDISLVLDTDLQKEMVFKINELRYFMNRAIQTMSQIYDELAYPDELFTTQRQLKEQLFKLLHMRQKSVDPVNVRYAEVWNKGVNQDIEILRLTVEAEETDIWPLLWFVKLNEDPFGVTKIRKNLEEMVEIIRRLVPEKEIVCELCKSPVLKTRADVSVHLFRGEHKNNLMLFENSQK